MKVVCIVEDGAWFYNNRLERKHWWSKKTHVKGDGPSKNDILTVQREYWESGVKYYVFIEWPNVGWYDSKWFTPIEENYEAISYEQIKEKASAN